MSATKLELQEELQRLQQLLADTETQRDDALVHAFNRELHCYRHELEEAQTALAEMRGRYDELNRCVGIIQALVPKVVES